MLAITYIHIYENNENKSSQMGHMKKKDFIKKALPNIFRHNKSNQLR
jgi:hypothetical protein